MQQQGVSSHRSIYFDCSSTRQSYRNLSCRWLHSRRQSEAGMTIDLDRQRLLELLDSMKRVYSEITTLGQQENEGTETYSERGDGVDYSYDELEEEDDDELEEEDDDDGAEEEERRVHTGLCDIDPISEVLERKKKHHSRCVSMSNLTEDREADTDQEEEGLSPTSSTYPLCGEGDDAHRYATDETSSSRASNSPGTEGGIAGANLGAKINIPKLQLHLLSDLPAGVGMTRRAQSAVVQTLSSAHTQLLSPSLTKRNEKLYEQIEDLGLQICENVKSLGEKYAAQKEKAEFQRFVNRQLVEKYERALHETEVLEDEISRIRNDLTERPPVSLYSLMMELRTPKLEKQDNPIGAQSPIICPPIPQLPLPSQNVQRQRHFRSMSVETQAEIRFVCREPPKVTVGVGEDSLAAFVPHEHRRYKSMEVSRVCLEPTTVVSTSLETETCVRTEGPLRKVLLQKLKEVLARIASGRTFGRAASGFSVQPPCPRIICGESL